MVIYHTHIMFYFSGPRDWENLRQHGAPYNDCKKGRMTAKMMAQIGTT